MTLVVANIQSAIRANDHINRPAGCFASGAIQPTGGKILNRSGRDPADQVQPDHLVAGRFAAVPGSVERDKKVASIFLRQLVGIIKGQS